MYETYTNKYNFYSTISLRSLFFLLLIEFGKRYNFFFFFLKESKITSKITKRFTIKKQRSNLITLLNFDIILLFYYFNYMSYA
jgi:hypothetical protein